MRVRGLSTTLGAIIVLAASVARTRDLWAGALRDLSQKLVGGDA